jgi:flagellar export protein FliJ
MAFRFPLQSLLKLRESLEHAEFMRLQAAVAAIVAIQAKIEAIEKERMNSSRAIFKELNQGISGSELEFEAVRQRTLTELRATAAKDLVAAEQRRREQLAQYQKARMAREILANLRVRQFEAYELVQNRKEQAQADELHLLRLQFADNDKRPSDLA